MSNLQILPCLDSPSMAEERRKELDIPRHNAAELGRSAVEHAKDGFYLNASGERVEWDHLVRAAIDNKVSLQPDAALPPISLVAPNGPTQVQVSNETTLQAARRLTDEGGSPLALNFANGVHPGGGFLSGARAQEENLCRSSALYHTLVGDPMYEYHRRRSRPDSTAWSIYSPNVPVFRTDAGDSLEEPWLLSFLTCAAPVAHRIGREESVSLMQERIKRVLEIAQAFGHSQLVLGAWGCGAFGNDPRQTARSFREALEGDFMGVFEQVIFAVTDWSPERRFLGPFCDIFSDAYLLP